MEVFINIARGWEWLNGKKTIIGTIIFFLSAFFSQVVGGIWEIESTWLVKLTDTLDWIGLALSSTGLSHKGVKMYQQHKLEKKE